MEIIVVSSTDQFRKLARDLPGSQASVLEIGCSTGETTQILARHSAQVVAVDVSHEMVDKAKCNTAGFSNVMVAAVDGRDMGQLRLMLPNPDLIFLDVGGTALLGNVTSLLRECLRVFEPKTIVVRSFELAELWSLITTAEMPKKRTLRRTTAGGKKKLAMKSLLDLSRSNIANDRIFAARKLRHIKTQDAIHRLSEMADDPNSKVRRISQLSCM